MGPYCRFCDQHCFVRVPQDAPGYIVRAYRKKLGSRPLMATCPQGKAYEKVVVGYCYDDVKKEEE